MESCRQHVGHVRAQCGAPPGRSCGIVAAEVEKHGTLAEIVASYLRHEADGSAAELAFFGSQNQELAEAVERAARSRLKSGAMHPHQYRVGHAACGELADSLITHMEAIDRSLDFVGIHDAVRHAAAGVYRVGELTIYDVAHRIGAYRRLHPEHVYLHRGTREGARNLGFKVNCRFLSIDKLPLELQVLSAGQVEDLLCIYKHALQPLL